MPLYSLRRLQVFGSKKEWTEYRFRINMILRKNSFSRKEHLTMNSSKRVHMLHLPFHGMMIHPTLLLDQEDAILIDTGFPGQFGELRAAIEKTGTSLRQLKAVILTHQDLDHIGNLPEISRKSWRKPAGESAYSRMKRNGPISKESSR